MNTIRELWERFVVWYWDDAMAAERHKLEVDAARFGGRITWER